MESLLKADIFFFIASIGIVVFTVVFIIIGCYLIKIMRNFHHISEKLRKTVDDADGELREMSEHVRESPVFSFIFGKKRKKSK